MILTERDPDRWYQSARDTVYGAVAPLPPDAPPVLGQVRQMSLDVVFDGQFDGRFGNREHALRVFTEHNEPVRREIAADRLLVFEVAQGWEPLCEFHGVPVPDEPFPHVNERAQLAATVEEHIGLAEG